MNRIVWTHGCVNKLSCVLQMFGSGGANKGAAVKRKEQLTLVITSYTGLSMNHMTPTVANTVMCHSSRICITRCTSVTQQSSEDWLQQAYNGRP